jgi:hypothetical protein
MIFTARSTDGHFQLHSAKHQDTEAELIWQHSGNQYDDIWPLSHAVDVVVMPSSGDIIWIDQQVRWLLRWTSCFDEDKSNGFAKRVRMARMK